MSQRPLLTAATLIVFAVAPEPSQAADPFRPDDYARTVQPFMQKHCITCHSEKKAEADLDLTKFLKVEDVLAARKVWQKIAKQLKAGAMPPDGRPRPAERDVLAVTAWLDAALAHVDPSKPADPGRVTARRLNRTEYDNTIRDLFGVSLHLAAEFPADDLGYGFDNIGDVLSVSPLKSELYLNAAEKLTTVLFSTSAKPVVDELLLATHFKSNGPRPRNGSDRGREMVPGSEQYFEFEFPAPGEYEITIYAWGVEKPEEKDRDDNARWLEAEAAFRPDPKARPVVEATILCDDRVAGHLPVVPGNATSALKQTYSVRLTTQAGFHTVRIRHRFPRDMSDEQVAAHLKQPLLAPRLGLRQVAVRGPLGFGSAKLTPAHEGLLKATPTTARAALRTLADRAWRRRATAAELDALCGFVAAQQTQGRTFTQALEMGVQAVLVSPHFLFRLEGLPPSEAKGDVALGGYALASRLSYFLWSSLPDDELFALAAKGTLTDPAVLTAQVDRMLRDPRAGAFVEGFFGQWLGLRKVPDVSVDPKRFPEFSSELKEDLRRETTLFVESLVRENRSALDLLRADYTYANDRLAQFYGLAGVEKGGDFRRVSLSATPRRGVLTHGSVLLLTSYPDRTSPTRRGNWVLEIVLGEEPPPPPDNVPELAKAQAAAPNLPLRKQLELHRTDPTCVSCHRTMDAIGFGLENFDAIGRWRDRDQGRPIDAAGELPGGKKFSTPRELIDILAGRQDDFARHLAGRLLTYALGRGVEYYDRPALDRMLDRTRGDGFRFRDMIREVVLSRPFLWQRVQPQETKP